MWGTRGWGGLGTVGHGAMGVLVGLGCGWWGWESGMGMQVGIWDGEFWGGVMGWDGVTRKVVGGGFGRGQKGLLGGWSVEGHG